MISVSDILTENNENQMPPEIFRRALLDESIENETIDFDELLKSLGTSQQSYDLDCIIDLPKQHDTNEMSKVQTCKSNVSNNDTPAANQGDISPIHLHSSIDATQVDLDQFIMDVMETTTDNLYHLANQPSAHHDQHQQHPEQHAVIHNQTSTNNKPSSQTPSNYSPSVTRSSEVSQNQTSTNKSSKPTVNNIPRHLRESHIRAERKRQSKIKNAREQLKDLLGLPRASENKIVEKAVERCRSLKAELVRMDNESSKLKKEKEALDAEIDTFIRNLPPTLGDEQLTCKVGLTDLYKNHYGRQKNQSSSKFGIFERIMYPLFESYVENVEKSKTKDEFRHGLQSWCKQNLSLINLRHKITFGLLDWQKSSNLVIQSPVIKASTKRQS